MTRTKSGTWATEFARRWAKYWVEPARPTTSELRYLRGLLVQRLRSKPKLAVLVLGSTSEYRDMLIELGVRTAVVDFSRQNYRTLSTRMKHRYQGKEDFFNENWITMRLNQQFDVVLGDAVINVVPKQKCEFLLKNIFRHMTPDGLFLAKTWVRFRDTPPYSAEDFVRIYRRRLRRDDFLKCITALFYLIDYDYTREYCEMPKTHTRVQRLFEAGKLTKSEWEHFRNLGMDITQFKFFFPKKTWLERLLKKYFVIMEIRQDTHFIPRYHPTYVLMRGENGWE